MKKAKVFLYHNQDGTYTVTLENDKEVFNLKVFSVPYEGATIREKIRSVAYQFAYALSAFLEIDFTEVK
jgi:hypothetical protein